MNTRGRNMQEFDASFGPINGASRLQANEIRLQPPANEAKWGSNSHREENTPT